MIWLLCFGLAALTSPFKSKIRLEAAENAAVCKNLSSGVVVVKSAQDWDRTFST
jgi:hypothetical protein